MQVKPNVVGTVPVKSNELPDNWFQHISKIVLKMVLMPLIEQWFLHTPKRSTFVRQAIISGNK